VSHPPALRWQFFREQFGYRESIAMLVIFAGILLVRRAERPSAQASISDRAPMPVAD